MPTSALFRSDSLELWTAARDSYPDALASRAAKKPQLAEIDKWFQIDLPQAVRERRAKGETPLITKAEASRVVTWKHTRGKFRPNQGKFDSNSEGTITSAIAKSLELADKIDSIKSHSAQLAMARKAIEAISKPVYGCGPATASAFLATLYPENFAFYSDEAVDSVCGVVKYDVKGFTNFLEGVWACRDRLNRKGSGWTAKDVETALWADRVLAEAGAGSATNSKKRSADDDGDRNEKKTRKD